MRVLLGIVGALLAVLPCAAGSDAWWDAEGDLSVAALGDLTEAEAVTYDRTDGFAAAAFTDPDRTKRSYVRMTIRGESRGVDDVKMPARVRSLLYVGTLDTLFVVVQRSGKARPLETYLVSIDVDALNASRRINLPHGSRGMAIWAREGFLVVSSTDEIRTFQLPGYRSGPLYRVPGENLAILNVAGTNRFLIGRNEGVFEVDFDDTPGREGLPIREQVATNAAVVGLAPLADGRVSILLADGRSRTLWVEPLRTTEARPDPPPPPPPPAPEAAPEPEEEIAATTTAATAAAAAAPPEDPPAEQPDDDPAAAETEPEADTAPPPELSEPVAEEAAVAAATAAAATAAAEDGTDDAPQEEIPEEPEPEPEPEAASVAAPEGADLYGRLSGEARGEVRWVVLQGPDNLLNEGARVAPDADGAWSCDGLAPGTYRVVLDAGGNRQVQSSPPFRVVRVEDDGEPIEVETIEVLRVR